MKKEAESAVERETERSVIDLEMHEKSTTTTKKKKKKKTKRNENKEEIAEHAVKKHKKLKKEKREGRDEVPLEPVVLPEIDFLPYNVENLELLKETVDGGLFLVRNFIAQHDCVSLLSKLLDEIPFPEERSIILHGLNVPEPRDVCYMGDLDVSNYRYGSIERSAVEWTPTVKALRNSIQRAMEEMEPLKKFRCNINCALLNLYRNGQDSMGEHADDEEELGWRRCIFSLSFGASRNVVFSNARTKETFQTLKINSGDLYIMVGWYFQWRFRHSVVKDETVDEPRINLSFRNHLADLQIQQLRALLAEFGAMKRVSRKQKAEGNDDRSLVGFSIAKILDPPPGFFRARKKRRSRNI